MAQNDDAFDYLTGDTEGARPMNPAYRFLWGAVRPPENLRLGGQVRGAFTSARIDKGSAQRELLLPRADLAGDFELDRFRVAASLGYAAKGSLKAAITRSSNENLVSREHWVGYELGRDRSWLVRAGRIAVPFGVRTDETTLWVRTATRTGLDDDQQHGVALFGTAGRFRGELMAIAGNFQLRTDDARERGYSAYVEVAPIQKLAFGASSLFTRARRDIDFGITNYRQAHGLFARYAPVRPLALVAEADWLYQSLSHVGHRAGHVTLLQGDWEAKEGVHLVLTGETKNDGAPGAPASYGLWASVIWFFAPHADLRLDEIYRRLGAADASRDSFAWFVALHVYL